MKMSIDVAKKLIKEFEGCKLQAYLCPANKWTIGYGNTFYEDGKPVKKGDIINQKRAEVLLDVIALKFEKEVRSLVKAKLNENQMGALIDFAFNLGSDIDADTKAEGLGDSTLLKLVNANPNNPAIRAEFMKWNKAGGKVLNGLTRRRQAEADVYFSKQE
jgi:lysozyme